MDFGYEAGQNVLHHLNMEIREESWLPCPAGPARERAPCSSWCWGCMPPAGHRPIQGVDPRSLTGPQRRALYGYVEQRFHRSPAPSGDQITLYDDTITEGQVRRAAELAGLAEAIGACRRAMTPLYPGHFLSGTVAAVVHRPGGGGGPQAALLDEITANLDAETERAVLRALKRATADRTVLSISHRVGADTGRLIPIGEES